MISRLFELHLTSLKMGSLLSSLPRNDAGRGREGKKKNNKKKYPTRKTESSSSSSFSTPTQTRQVRHKKLRHQLSTSSSSSSSPNRKTVRGNVKKKTVFYNQIDKSSSPHSTKSTSISKSVPKGRKKGFDYRVDDQCGDVNQRIVTVELDIPELKKGRNNNTSTQQSRGRKMTTKKDFEEACINAHNEYRRCHGSKQLERDTKLTSMAQEWANKLAKKGRLEHSNNRGFGENVAFTSKSDPSGPEMCKMWYDEIKDYNFRNPGFAGNTGHFTQVVWKGSTHVGIGIATGSKGTFVVANYKPAGNITNPGYFKENVGKQRSKPVVAECARGRKSSSSSSSSSDEGTSRRRHQKSDHKTTVPKPGKTVDTKTEIFTENGVRKKKTITTTTTVTVTSGGTKTEKQTKTKIENLPDNDSVTGKLKKLRVRKDSSSSSSSSSDDDDGKNVMSESDKRKFRKDCLDRHNELRKRHGAQKLKQSSSLQDAAQRHANKMLRQGKLSHTGKQKYGENVAMKMPMPSGSEACDMWFDEKKNYDFRKSVFSGNTGHFTQVVWDGTKEIGIGVASDAQGKTYIASFYDPPGNVRGEFERNVRRG